MQGTYISFRVVKKTKGNYFEYILLNSVYLQYCHRNMQFQHEVFYTFFFSYQSFGIYYVFHTAQFNLDLASFKSSEATYS